MENRTIGFLLLFASVITYLNILVGSIFTTYYLGAGLGTLIGICGMLTVLWQIKLALKKIKDN